MPNTERMGSVSRLILAVAAAAWAATACASTPATPSGGASGSLSAPSSVAPDPTSSEPVPSVGPGLTYGPMSSPTPVFEPVPTGDWTSIQWGYVAGSLAPDAYPAITPDTASESTVLEGPNAILTGLRNQYLQLIWDPIARTLTPWLSTDALAWRQGTGFDLSMWTSAFKSWDKTAPDDTSKAGCGFNVDDLVEGPSGVLLRANLECHPTLGEIYQSPGAMWISSDGLNWKSVSPSRAFGKSGIGPISGGANGFIGLNSDRTASWVSQDGLSWKAGTIPCGATELSDPVSIDGEFAIAGLVAAQSGQTVPPKPGGCKPFASGSSSLVTGAVWRSKDGANWTRDRLDTTAAVSPEMTLRKIDDHTLIADQLIGKKPSSGVWTSDIAWISRDGKPWTPVKGVPGPYSGYGFATYRDPSLIVGRDRGLMMLPKGDNSRFLAFNADGTPRELEQTGDVPTAVWSWTSEALGAVGLLVCSGTDFWIGLPG